MRFVTYNIRLGIQAGVEAIADAVRPQDPDVLALQEVGRDWIMGPEGDTTARIAGLLGFDHFRHVPAIAQDGGEYGHALLSRFPIHDPRVIALPMEVDEPRTLLLSRLATPLGDVHVVSTHLSWIEDRPMQGQVLLRTVDRLPDPVVVMGDLNGDDDEEFLVALRESFVDADDIKRRLTFPSSEPRQRIDYLLVRGGEWEGVAVGDDVEASDHHWVAATLRLRD